MNIGIRFPFKETNQGGLFTGTKTTLEKVRTNLISLLTTKRGQRPMRNSYFSPIYDYIFENYDEVFQQELSSKISNKVKEFIPEVQIKDIIFLFEEGTHILEIKILYSVSTLGNALDQILIELQLETQR